MDQTLPSARRSTVPADSGSAEATPAVFVVDDEPGILQFLDAALRAMRFHPHCFVEPEEFLARPWTAAVGCLIVDLNLRNISGIDVARRARERGLLLPSILISGRVSVPEAVTAMQRGMFAVLEKPFRLSHLQREVQEAVDFSQSRYRELTAREMARRKLATLSASESLVYALLVDGMSNKAIALRLQLGLRTVEARRQAVLRKLDVASIAELVQFRLRWDPLAELADSPPTVGPPLQGPHFQP